MGGSCCCRSDTKEEWEALKECSRYHDDTCASANARASFDTHWKENQGSNAIWMLIMYLIINLIYICYLQCRYSQKKMMTTAIARVS